MAQLARTTKYPRSHAVKGISNFAKLEEEKGGLTKALSIKERYEGRKFPQSADLKKGRANLNKPLGGKEPIQ